MDESFLYKQIAENIRREILDGKYKSGDRLPSMRQMAVNWGCTVGTIQRAYLELADQGLVVSRAGQGSRVTGKLPAQEETPLRRATLTHRAEAFLLESLTAGYQLEEVGEAVQLAMDRWRAVRQSPVVATAGVLRFAGSHDIAVTWLAAHFSEIAPGYSLQASFSGSLGGLIALARGEADVAGSHLWDEESDTYNLPFVRRLLPGKRTALVTLAHRRLGLILPAGNPAQVSSLRDLERAELRFVNRQAGSGTRVWLDAALRKAGVRVESIQGYEDEKITHSEVALAVAEERADVGLGLEASARAYGLDFIPLARERYDLVMRETCWELEPAQMLVNWLVSSRAKQTLSALAGYDAEQTGRLEWVG